MIWWKLEVIYDKPWSVLVAGFQCSVLMIGKHTCPFSSTLGWYIFVLKVIFGGLKGYSAGKFISMRKAPLLYGTSSWDTKYPKLYLARNTS